MAVDIPGYGRSPKADPGLTLGDIAAACWAAVDELFGNEPAILVGCSVGAQVLPHMYRQNSARARAIILTGVGYDPAKQFAQREIDAYVKEGVAHRHEHLFYGMSPAFRATPMAQYLADLFTERDRGVDVPSLLHQFRAHQMPDPDDLHSRIACPAIIITGSEDGAHQSSFALKERIPGCELKLLPGGGHTCQFEQPWLFDRLMIEFLTRHDLLPGP